MKILILVINIIALFKKHESNASEFFGGTCRTIYSYL